MPIQAVESHRLYRQIADQMSALIASGEFPEGSRLPSERDLASQLGVSRPSVREALIALEVQGKVEVRVGAGVFVATSRSMSATEPDAEGQGPFELLRARWILEGEVTWEAARNATPEDLEPVRRAVADMQLRQRQNREADTADRDFHMGIARASHNSALVAVVHDLWDAGRGAIWKRMEQHFQTPAMRAATLSDHRAILDALESGDGPRARTAMRRHVARVERDFNRGWERVKERGPEGGPPNGMTAPQAAAPKRRRT